MISIGMIGPPVLLQRNREILQQQQIQAFSIIKETQLTQIDGLLITGWRQEDYAKQLNRLRAPVKSRIHELSLLGIAAGAAALGQNNLLAVMNCDVLCRPSCTFSTSILEMPGFTENRSAAIFCPEIQFINLAPSLGILCQHPRHGPVIVRQGDVLACSYIAEWTAHPHIYHYWLEMVAALKNSRDF